MPKKQESQANIKEVIFKQNPYGVRKVVVNCTNWVVVSGFGISPELIGRACRFSGRGSRLEYREGSRYHDFGGEIESILDIAVK